MSLTVERTFPLARTTPRVVTDEPAPVAPTGRTPRITRLLALAIKFDMYIREGIVDDYATLAHLGHVTRARMTQILDLTLLAPDIQLAILDLPPTIRGRDPIGERQVRKIAHLRHWTDQRQAWHCLRTKLEM